MAAALELGFVNDLDGLVVLLRELVLGAGVGDLVLITSDGSYTRTEIIGTKLTPARWAIVGIIDSVKKPGSEE